MNLARYKKFFVGPKIIFVILFAILVAEIIYAASVFLAPSPTPVSNIAEDFEDQVEKTSGRISLLSERTDASVGDILRVSVNIETGGYFIDGADLIVRYDPKILEATPGGLVKGTILDEYPLVSLDAKKGLISISGISSLKNGYRGEGEFATLVFKAKSRGQTEVAVEYEEDSTTDSNLVENSASKDILDSVDNIGFNIN